MAAAAGLDVGGKVVKREGHRGRRALASAASAATVVVAAAALAASAAAVVRRPTWGLSARVS